MNILAATLAEWGAFLVVIVPLFATAIVSIIKQFQDGKRLAKVEKVVDFQTEVMHDNAKLEAAKQKVVVDNGSRMAVDPNLKDEAQAIADKLETATKELKDCTEETGAKS